MALALDLTDATKGPFHYLAVLTSGEKDVKLPRGKEVAIKHTGRKSSDGSSASSAGDHLVIMHETDTMAANRGAGVKIVLEVGESVTFRAGDILPSSADGSHVIQLRAVTNGCMVQFLVGQITRKS